MEEKKFSPKEEKQDLSSLAPSKWQFEDFKTYFLNSKDKSGAGMDKLTKEYDP